MNIDFFNFVNNLKTIPRKGWQDKLGLEHPESVADHCFSMTAMAMVIASIEKLDVEKIMKMAILHDLAESIIGDYMPNEIPKKQKKKLEDDAMNTIIQTLPKEIVNEYTKIWNEFQDQKTKEAQILHQIDKLEMALQAKYYLKTGHTKKQIETFIDTANNEIKNNTLRKIFLQIFE